MNVDAELLGRLAGPGPRYTSYPTAPEWTEDVGADVAHATYRKAAASAEPLRKASLGRRDLRDRQ